MSADGGLAHTVRPYGRVGTAAHPQGPMPVPASKTEVISTYTYNRAGTPFGGKREVLQSIRVTGETVTIRPAAMLWMLTVLLLLMGMVFPAAVWIRDLSAGRTERLPELWEAGIAFGFEILALILLWGIHGQSLVIDEYGVEWRRLLRKRYLRWREIHDYGLSYAYWGQVRV